MDYYYYHLHLSTFLHLCTLLFCICGLCCYYFVALFPLHSVLLSYSAIFIAASVQNKIIVIVRVFHCNICNHSVVRLSVCLIQILSV